MSPRAVVLSTKRAFVRSPSATLIGVITGAMLALWWPQLSEWSSRFYDTIHPVATGEPFDIIQTPDSVTFKLRITRNRACKYGPPPQAFIEFLNGDLTVAEVKRLDGVPPNINYPVGSTYYVGMWQISPVASAVSARMIALYDCGGRMTYSVIADIKL
jgi:hypothetical protein